MKQLSSTGKKFLIGAIAAAILFVACVVMFSVSIVIANQKTDLGLDISGYNVVKMATNAEGDRIAGTQSGEIFAFNEEGEMLWNVGKLRECATYDIVARDGKVYAVYADGTIAVFSEGDAKAYASAQAEREAQRATLTAALAAEISAEEGEAESEEVPSEEVTETVPETPSIEVMLALLDAEEKDFIENCTLYKVGYSISGNVSNTQLLVGSGEFYLRAKCQDSANRNYIFRFAERSGGEGSAPELVLSPSSFSLGGMALFGGQLYYAYRGQLRMGGEKVLLLDEDILALSADEEGLSMITAGGKLVVYDVERGEISFEGALSEQLDPLYIFSTGENFLAKIKNGGVALIDVSERGVTLSLPTGNDANFILWSDDCFMLRDASDVNHPVTLFYSVDHAHTAALFSVLQWVFLAVGILALAAAVILFLCISKEFRQKLKEGTIAFFKAVWRDRAIYLALLIPFALLITFYYIPIILGFSISFMDYVPGERAVFEGIKYFKMVVGSVEFWQSVGTMLLFLLADIAKALIPPFIIAELLIICKLKNFSLWIRILLFLPGILPGVAATLVWQQGVFGSSTNSLVNAFIKLFAPTFTGLNWIYNPSFGVRVLTIICFGFPWVGSYLIFFGALQGINTSIFEAAKLDGCPWLTRVFCIDIPLIVSQIKYVIITTFIASVQNYGTLYILYGTGAGDTLRTPALMMYSEIMSGNYNIASVMGVFLFLFLAVVTVLNFRSQKEQIE